MSHDKPNEEIRELAALFSLGALTQHEADGFKAHIREGCPVCEAEYDRFKHITAEIGLTVNETAVPEYLKELLLARIERATPVETPVSAPENTPEEEKKEDVGAEETEEKEPVAKTPPEIAPRPVLTQPPKQRSNFIPWILVIVLAVAGALLYFAYDSEKSGNDELAAVLATVRSDKENLETLLENQKGSQGELEQIISAVSKPETRILHLAGYDIAPSISGAGIWDVQENQCLIFGYMPPAPAGKTYQLWYITDTEKISAGLLKPDPKGRISSILPIPEKITNMTMVVTLEPENGSKVPTLPFYAIVRKD